IENSINVDEDYSINFDDDDDDELLPFNKVIEIHKKPNKTEQDIKLAWKCFDAHADLGNKNAIYWKAHYLWEGYCVEQDREKAIELFKIAADSGVAEAQFRYAMTFIAKLNDPPSNKDIFSDYLTKSADNGYDMAMFNLGMCCYSGKCEIPQNKHSHIITIICRFKRL